MVETEPCGKVVHYSSVKAEPVSPDMATATRIRWLIGPSDEPPLFYMRMFEVDPGGHINAHFHPWEHEIYVLEGSGRVRIGGGSTRSRLVMWYSYRLMLSTSTGPGMRASGSCA